jgi:hypothetical protein
VIALCIKQLPNNETMVDKYSLCTIKEPRRQVTCLHRPRKVRASNANGVGKQLFEVSKQLQGRHIDVVLPSETNLKPHEIYFIPNYHFYRTDLFPYLKRGTVVFVTKYIPHNHRDLPPLASTEVTEICVPVAKTEVLLTAVYKPPGRAWNDADVIKILNLRNNSLVAGDLKAKNSVWNSQFPSPSGQKLFTLLVKNHFQISASHIPTKYPSQVVDIVVQQNVRLSAPTVPEVLH